MIPTTDGGAMELSATLEKVHPREVAKFADVEPSTARADSDDLGPTKRLDFRFRRRGLRDNYLRLKFVPAPSTARRTIEWIP